MTKRTAALLLIAAVLITACAGCAGQGGGKNEETEKIALPTQACQPGTLATDSLFEMVSGLVGYNEDGEKVFEMKKSDADAFEVPGMSGEKERLYLMQMEDLEFAVFADISSDCVTSLYVRRLFDDDLVEAYMASFAGAFLSILEPVKYNEMLDAVLPKEGQEEQTQAKSANGEIWRIEYTSDIAKLMPIE